MVVSAPHETIDDDKQELFDRVVDAVEALPPHLRRILEAYFWERKSFRAIAREEGCHPKNTWRRYQNALKLVHAKLGEVFD